MFLVICDNSNLDVLINFVLIKKKSVIAMNTNKLFKPLSPTGRDFRSCFFIRTKFIRTSRLKLSKKIRTFQRL